MDARTRSIVTAVDAEVDLDSKDKSTPSEAGILRHDKLDDRLALASHLMRLKATRSVDSINLAPIGQYEGASATVMRILDALEEISFKIPTPTAAND